MLTGKLHTCMKTECVFNHCAWRKFWRWPTYYSRITSFRNGPVFVDIALFLCLIDDNTNRNEHSGVSVYASELSSILRLKDNVEKIRWIKIDGKSNLDTRWDGWIIHQMVEQCRSNFESYNNKQVYLQLHRVGFTYRVHTIIYKYKAIHCDATWYATWYIQR